MLRLVLLSLFVCSAPLRAMDLGAADALFGRQAYSVSAEAYRDLLHGAPDSPDDDAERLGFAESLFRSGQEARARLAYEDYLERHVVGRRQGRALLGLADDCAALKDYAGAVQAALRAEAVLPRSDGWRAVLIRAEALYDAGRYAQAEAVYVHLTALWPGKPSAAYGPYARAWCEYRLGKQSRVGGPAGAISPAGLADLARSASLFKRCLALDGAGSLASGALYQEGECAYALGHWDEAAGCWRSLPARFPSDALVPAARYSLAWCLFEQGHFNEAATAFHEFSVIYADHALAPWALYLAGVSLARARNLDLAESAYRICLNLYPRSVVADRCAYGLAWLATMRKDYISAAEGWTRFLAEFPGSPLAPSAVFLLADSQYQQGRFAAAHDEYMDLLNRYPSHPLAQDALYYAANASLALGDWAKSSSEFHAFLDARPGSAFVLDARLHLADCDYSKGDFAAAAKGYQDLRAQAPGTKQAAEALLGLAWVSFSRRDWAGAARRFEDAAGGLSGADAGRARLRAGDAWFNAEEHARAQADYLRAASAAYPRSIRAQAHFGAAWADYRLKDFDRAAGEWDEARGLSPDPDLRAAASYWIGWALFRQGRYAQAASVFSAVASRYPVSHLVPDALVQEANSLHNAGEDEQALPLYRKVADAWPQLPAAADALHGLQISYTALGREDDAVAAERSFLKSHAASSIAPEVQYQIAEHYLDAKDWAQAAKELDVLKAQFPGSKVDLAASYWRGEARFQQMKFGDAIRDWEDLVHRAPSNPLAPRAAFRVGLAWYRQQEYPQAEDAFRRVLDAYGNTREVAADARFNLALTYKRMSRDPDAVAAYQAVIRDYPGSPLADMARIRIGYIYEDSGQYAKALEAYRDLAGRDKGKIGAEAQYLVGDCLVDLKQNGEALLAYDAVARNFPGQGAWAVTALARGAEILESQGRYREALTRYETIAKTSPDPSWAASAHARAVLLRRRLGLPAEGARTAKARRKARHAHKHRAVRKSPKPASDGAQP